MDQYRRKAIYATVAYSAAIGAQALAGGLVARKLGKPPWTGAAVGLVAGMAGGDMMANAAPGTARHEIGVALAAPSLGAEWVVEQTVLPLLR